MARLKIIFNMNRKKSSFPLHLFLFFLLTMSILLSIEEAKQLKKRVAKMEERMKAMEAAYRQEQEKARQAEARAAKVPPASQQASCCFLDVSNQAPTFTLKAEEAVARLKRKEQRETQQLQEMVQGVERNLHLTTTRCPLSSSLSSLTTTYSLYVFTTGQKRQRGE